MSHLDYEINKELGECYLFMGELDKAEDYYKKAASSNGVHPDPYLGLATIAVQRGDLDAALTLYSKAHGIDANDKTFSGMGLVKMEQGLKDDAFDLFQNALARNPENMVALLSLIRLGHELERLSEILAPLESYLSLNPGKSEVRYSLAGCLVCLDRKDEAQAQLEQIVAADPSFAPAQELLAQLDD
ncbi:Tetratricopeptide repeat-containing protein [Humidesulfovibrio mexicanus]|jgi:tetratricopeptide (TPR) repeat protein|uniref:Tetratricopeptide repeat-containing protein n=1 Tax=Humidesulfovibrio mexicanus TaxID=147047 RepID=A0A239AQ91_9BACT|nr:tetratricopeptide repeat protein [Humidesulfovibrio mexicanus]SNR97103.1 Tetratricopeptide repeat-containing protein [Humidesulfovibrio mexicanus]